VEEEQGISRGEVLAMMGALADTSAGVERILGHIEGDEDGQEEEDVPDA
jgi:hypothetical protein